MLVGNKNSIAWLLNFGRCQLNNAVDTPQLDSELILCFVLNVCRSYVIFNPDVIIEPKLSLKFKELIKKRNSGYSIAQIIGKKSFWKSEFIITKDTFAPRPDTETIIEAVLFYYKNRKQNLKIAELGTGTGCIIISLLGEYKNSVGYGFEKSHGAYLVSQKNIKIHKLQSRSKIFYSDFCNCAVHLPRLDIMVSNPPYIKKFHIKALQKEVQKEPMTALDGGINGIHAYFTIFRLAKKILKKNGRLFLEIGDRQEILIKNLNILQKPERVFRDLSGKIRVIVFCVR
jgi:release factor glutamine methyltransferase